VALVQLYRTIARPPDALLPVVAMLAGVLVPAAVQQDVLIGAALGCQDADAVAFYLIP
jgi:hypothetical protein